MDLQATMEILLDADIWNVYLSIQEMSKAKRGKEAWVMALPIARTPKLNTMETDKFLKDVETGLKNTVGYTNATTVSVGRHPHP